MRDDVRLTTGLCILVLIVLVMLCMPTFGQTTAEDWLNKGNSFSGQGKYDDAIKAYDEAIRLDPTKGNAWINKAFAFYDLGKYDEADKTFDEAIRSDPQNANLQNVLYWNYKGDFLYQQGKYNEAVTANDEAIKIYEDAITLYGDSPRVASNCAGAWYKKGKALDKLGKYDDAIESYNKAISIDADISTSMLKEGNYHYDAGEYVAAIRYYDEAIRQDPEDENAWYNKAMALRMLDRNSEADTAFAKADKMGYTNPPEYVDEVSVQKAGSDGAWVYFILKDKDMAQTTSDGKVTLTIKSGIRQLYKKTYNVTKSDFQNTEITTTLGGSQYSENDLIYDFGRVKISEPRGDNARVTASIKFVTPDKRTLENEGTTYW